MTRRGIWFAAAVAVVIFGARSMAPQQRGPATTGAPSAAAALAALDTITASDWLHQSSASLLERVLAKSSKSALDEAAKTDARAQALVGAGYHFGLGGYPRDLVMAAAYYRRGAVSNPIAQVNLGALLKDGLATPDGKPAPVAAADFFRKAADQGHAAGALNLAFLYRDGIGVPRDDKEAARWFKAAADQRNARAQYELGQLYRYGLGVPEDLDEFERLNKLAANQGFADALYADALYKELLLEPEETVNQLYKKAFDAFARDAAAGDGYAAARLGDMYSAGDGIPRNPAAAYAQYKKSADLGNPGGLLNVGILTERGDGVASDPAAAVAIYKQLALKGYADAEYQLARVTEAGIGGIPQNRNEALRLYKLAAQHGSEQAQDYLKKQDITR